MSSYYVGPLVVFILLAYALGLYLIRNKIISLGWHRRLWNYVLLVSFLISGILGLVLAALIEYNLFVSWYHTILWLHVELGIVMAIVSIIHILWHWNYFWRRRLNK